MLNRTLRALRACAVFTGLLLAASTTASADVEMAAPNALTPVPSQSAPGTITPQWSYQSGTFVCNGLVTVQAKASGFATGNCLNGTHLRRNVKSAMYDNSTWEGGYVFGNFQACGFVNSNLSSLVSNTTENLCGDNNQTGMTPSQYMAGTNEATVNDSDCQRHQRPDGSWRCTDGTPVGVVRACTEYANFRPWAQGQIPIEPIRTIPAGSTLRWRYIARYYPADGSGQGMVMVRDPNYSAGNGNWVFVSASCLAGFPGLTTTLTEGGYE